MTSEDRQIISAVKDRLFSQGWGKIGWGPEGVHKMGGLCLIAHVYSYLTETNRCEKSAYICGLISEEIGLGWSIDIAWWNDHKDRTLEDVIDVLDRLLTKDEQKKEVREEVLVSTTSNR